MKPFVIDASAVLALMFKENGQNVVLDLFKNPNVRIYISAVNWSEVVQKSLQAELQIEEIKTALLEMGLRIAQVTAEDAEYAARIWQLSKVHGLSIADRLCFALGARMKAKIYTADKVWLNLSEPLALSVECIR